MATVSTLPLSKKDRKRLRFKRIFNSILTWYTVVIALAMLVFGIYLIFFDGEKIGWLLLLSVAIMSWVVHTVYQMAKKLKRDLEVGEKEVIQGTIEKKYRRKQHCEFTINGQKYLVNTTAYFSYKKGDHVLISFAPNAKVMLDISAINDQKPEA